MKHLKNSIIKILFASLFLSSPSFSLSANGDEFTSAYTQIDLNECTLLNADDFGARFACPGYKGFPLYVAEGDLRFFISYGFGAIKEKAAEQTLAPFNTVGGQTIEWRLNKNEQSGNWFVFATILRWITYDDASLPDGQILIVTKIKENNTCHIAYIDAKLVPNANEIARKFADEEAKNFNCETDDIFMIPS